MGDEADPPYEWTMPPSEPPSPFIMTFDELRTTQEAIQNKETQDRSAVFRFVEPDTEELKRRLLQWASAGFPDTYMIFSISVIPPSKCVDGETRTMFDYVNYLLSSTLYDKFQVLQAKLPGMTLSYSLPSNQICMHVSRA
jgi:hypothetical protein